MATFDRAQLQHVAELASLSLAEEEATRFAADIQRIVAYVDELATVDTTNVEPTTIVTPLVAAHSPREASALRTDAPAPSLPRDEVMAQAPRATEQGFLVPTFLES